MKSQLRSAELIFFIEWTAINIAGFSALNIIILPVIGIPMYVLLSFHILEKTAAWIILLTIGGLVIGILQWRVIRNFVNQPSKLWIFTAVLGCVISGSTINMNLIGIGPYAPETSQSVDLNSYTLFGVLVGLISSALQLIIIPVRGYRILAWVFFNALIGVVVLFISARSIAISQFAAGPVVGILVGMLTGALWLWMLEDNSEEPGKV